MRRLALLAVLVAVLAAPALVRAQNPEASLSRTSAAIGEHVALTIFLDTAVDAVVVVEPAADSWGDVRVIRVLSQSAVAVEGGLHHRIEVLVAPFAPGSLAFRPALTVTTDAGSTLLELPALTVEVPSSLAPGEPLTLSPLPPPARIAGAQSPLLLPAIIVGAIAVVTLVGGLLALGVRWWRSRPRPGDEPAPQPPPNPDEVLADAASLLEADASGAYRAIASAVRHVLGERYAFPARSLTTAELESRMEGAGVDGWQARLARELLRECDAVVYAGYRPALERRHADLTVAREIVGGAG